MFRRAMCNAAGAVHRACASSSSSLQTTEAGSLILRGLTGAVHRACASSSSSLQTTEAGSLILRGLTGAVHRACASSSSSLQTTEAGSLILRGLTGAVHRTCASSSSSLLPGLRTKLTPAATGLLLPGTRGASHLLQASTTAPPRGASHLFSPRVGGLLPLRPTSLVPGVGKSHFSSSPRPKLSENEEWLLNQVAKARAAAMADSMKHKQEANELQEEVQRLSRLIRERDTTYKIFVVMVAFTVFLVMSLFIGVTLYMLCRRMMDLQV